jgi:spoIIIJ-associated protein
MIEKMAKSVAEATKAALLELGITEEQAEIEIIEEPSSGFLGFMAKPARVRVTKILTKEDIAKEFLSQVFDKMNMELVINITHEEGNLHINLVGQDLGILIGRRGETLDALQYLLNLIVNKKFVDRVRIILDVENYRKRREETLVNLARRLSDKVKRTGISVYLEPMNPHERRIIHTALQMDTRIFTLSEGEEPFRKVVISVKK